MASGGDGQTDEVEAANADEAMRRFRARGLFVTKVTELTNRTDEGTPSASTVPESVMRASHGAKGEPVVEEPPPGSQVQCRLIGEQLGLYIPPCSGRSVPFPLKYIVGRFPLVYLGGVAFFTVAAVFLAFKDGEYWPFIPLGLMWPIGLGLFYLWLSGRFGKTHVLIEPGRLVTKFELFGRQKLREYFLDENSCASLVADYYVGGETGDLGSSRGDPVHHVHVTTTRRPAKFGSYLSREEKDWIVARINRHLGH